MAIEDQLRKLQDQLDLISGYKLLTALQKLPVRKNAKVRGDIADQILKELISFASKRIDEIEGDPTPAPIATPSLEFDNIPVFSENEVFTLKQLANRLSKSNNVGMASDMAPLPVSEVIKPKVAPPIKHEIMQPVADATAKLVVIGNVQPVQMREKLSAYDIVKVLSVDGDQVRVQHIKTGASLIVPAEDLE